MKYLGNQTNADLVGDPDSFLLECVDNPEPNYLYSARFTVPEFTSLCPVTGQPDYATLIIDYIPSAKLVESKALKLYCGTFRNVGDFHEACTNKIANKIMEAAKPYHLRLCAFWYPRGGIPIDVFVTRDQGAKYGGAGTWNDILPPFPMRDYRGR